MSRLHDLSVLIVDCQTTGATPELGAVLELGWCIMRPESAGLEALQSYWLTLPEGHRISSHVRRLTGYDEQKLAGALAPEAAWRRLRSSMDAGAMPTAIHFARFELGFLRDWAQRFDPGAEFPFAPICVHAVACRLYPELPRRSIRALAGYLGHGLDLTRRALGHVEATAHIWRKLSAELEARGVHTWTELGAWLEQSESAPPRSKKRRYPLPSSRYRTLPDEPGVYQLLRSNGDVLYVGKATSLKKRVTSHFAVRSTREHSLEMLTQVGDVRYTLTPTPLEAALLENESIKTLRPPYNLQLTAYERRAWFTERSFHDATTTPDEVHRIGPLPSEYSLRALGALVELAARAAPMHRLRARAVNVSERWAPDEVVFAAGFDEFARRHLAGDGSPTSPHGAPGLTSARQVVLAAAKHLSLLSRLTPSADDEAAPDSELEPSQPARWDPDRVTRHLERALLRSYQLLRRAMWLRLLQDSVVVYREPGSARERLLCIRRAELVESRDLAVGETVTAPARSGLRCGSALSRLEYDRLRILASELERVHRDGGKVAVFVAPGRRLGDRVMEGVWGWV